MNGALSPDPPGPSSTLPLNHADLATRPPGGADPGSYLALIAGAPLARQLEVLAGFPAPGLYNWVPHFVKKPFGDVLRDALQVHIDAELQWQNGRADSRYYDAAEAARKLWLLCPGWQCRARPPGNLRRGARQDCESG